MREKKIEYKDECVIRLEIKKVSTTYIRAAVGGVHIKNKVNENRFNLNVYIKKYKMALKPVDKINV